MTLILCNVFFKTIVLKNDTNAVAIIFERARLEDLLNDQYSQQLNGKGFIAHRQTVQEIDFNHVRAFLELFFTSCG